MFECGKSAYQRLGVTPNSNSERPSILNEMYKANLISEPIMSFWKDPSKDSIFLHFGRLDLSIVRRHHIDWVDLDTDAHGWGVSVNRIEYGNAEI